MRKGFMLAAVLALVWLARPAEAHIVEITTTIAVETASGTTLDEAIHRAVTDVLRQTITFEPTLVAVTGSRVVGNRLVVRLMIMDEEGERLLRELAEAPDSEPDQPAASVNELRT
jgi:hypothetical protein